VHDLPGLERYAIPGRFGHPHGHTQVPGQSADGPYELTTRVGHQPGIQRRVWRRTGATVEHHPVSF